MYILRYEKTAILQRGWETAVLHRNSESCACSSALRCARRAFAARSCTEPGQLNSYENAAD